MDVFAGIIAVLLLLLLIGTGVVLIALDARGEGLAPLQERLRPVSDALERLRATRLPARPVSSGGVVARHTVTASRPAPGGEIVPIRPDAASEPARWEELRSQINEHGERLERQTDERAEWLARRYEELARETQARQETSFDRLRADVADVIGGGTGRRVADRMVEREIDALTEIYARLARLEAALAAVTHPMLLPGEPYQPPAELLPESLVWENWKDVGERSFALADHFNAHRLVVPAPLAAELASFITMLREELTGDIYPNLRPDATPSQRHTLEDALSHLAADLPKVRGLLETAYRGRGNSASVPGIIPTSPVDR